MAIDHGWATSTGRRADNQDRCSTAPTRAVLSDGMGGHAGGALAADLVVEAACSSLAAAAGSFDADLLDAIVRAANNAVRDRRASDPRVATMGATLTIAAATRVEQRRSAWLVSGLGDSPAWLVTPTEVRQVTETHSLAGELARAGTISAEEEQHHPGRHMLMRSIGADPDPRPHTEAVELRAGDALVLASDGLSDVISGVDLAAVVAAAPTASALAEALVDAALEEGSTDNVTVAVLRQQ
jgi:protein phosphatase